jgi:hypothetical protein
MLRLVLLVLVIANAAFFAWSQGFLAPMGWAPAQVTQPERSQQDIQASSIRLLNSSAEPERPPSTPPTEALLSAESTSCLWATGFSPGQAQRLRAAMSTLTLPESAWSLTEKRNNGRWIVYWGKFERPEVMAQRKATLRKLKIDYREVTLPRLAPGLALGTYSNEEAVKEALAKVQALGVRSARIAVERSESVTWSLRLPAITEEQRTQVAALGEALAGKSLLPCP